MQENFTTSESPSSSGPGTATSVRQTTRTPSQELMTIAAKEETGPGQRATVTDVATKMFMAKVIEAQLLLSNAVNEWNLNSNGWRNNVQRARNALNDLIRFGEF